MAYLQLEYKKDWDRAWQEREIFVALQPNDQAYIAMGAEIAIRAGRPDDAIAALTRDIPWDANSLWSSPKLRLGWAYFVKGDYKTALEQMKEERNTDPIWTLPFLAATYAELGLMTEARDTVKKFARPTRLSRLPSLPRCFPTATRRSPTAWLARFETLDSRRPRRVNDVPTVRSYPELKLGPAPPFVARRSYECLALDA